MSMWMQKRAAGRRVRGWALAGALALAASAAAEPPSPQTASRGTQGPAAEAVAGAPSSTARPPAEAFFRPRAVLEARLSPSGARLAITVLQRQLGRVGLVVIELEGPAPVARTAAVFRDVDVQRFEWVDDERLVFSVDDLQSASGPAEAGPGLYAVRHDGTDMLQLVQRRSPFGVFERSIAGGALRWDHVLLHVPAPSEGRGAALADEVIVGRWDFDRDEPRRVLPRWLNIRTGKTRPYRAGEVPEGARRWWFTPRGEPRVVQTVEGNRVAYHAYTPAGADGGEGRWRLLGEGTRTQMPFHVVSVGAASLHVTQRRGPAGESVLVPFDLDQGRPGDAPLVEVPGFDFSGTLMHDRDGRLLGVRVNGELEQTVWLDDARRALQEQADRLLPGRINRLSCRRCAAPDAVALVRSYSDRHPGELLLFTRADGRWRRLSEVLPGIDERLMAGTEFHRVAARDGRPLPLWITGAVRGAGGTPQARPAVVLVHGGPWVRGGHWRWEPIRQFLASRGWVVIEPDFRGSDGYGEAHLRAGFRQWGRAMQDDVADALAWARSQGLAGPRACIAGGSYGGYSALMGLVKHPALYRCGAAWAAVTDPLLYLEGSWWVRDDISDSARQFPMKEMVGDPDADREHLLANSPVAQAAGIRAPLLLAFGERDLRVPLAHGKRLRAALADAGHAPLEWVVYPDEGHGFTRPDNELDFMRRLERFLARHLDD